jgi:ABC-type lipoprotein export system ATPase subunit
LSSQAQLSLERVSKSYWRGPHETTVLKDISLSVFAGECVAVWGQRGSGKTTLL